MQNVQMRDVTTERGYGSHDNRPATCIGVESAGSLAYECVISANRVSPSLEPLFSHDNRMNKSLSDRTAQSTGNPYAACCV